MAELVMYALVGDLAMISGTYQCVIISYDDDRLCYLVFIPLTRKYESVEQRFISRVDRWEWSGSEVLEDITALLV